VQGQNIALKNIVLNSKHFAPLSWYASKGYTAALTNYKKTIDVTFLDTPVEKALKRIARKGHLRLSYSKKELGSYHVTLIRDNVTIIEAVEEVLRDTGLKAVASPDGQVVIKKVKEESLPTVKLSEATVSGTVTDAQTGDPLPGVNILVVGTSTGAATDSKGHYSLSVSSLQDTLRFSFIGYQTKTVPINGRTTINVAMKTTVFSGNQLVVTALGVERKHRSLGYNVDTVGTGNLTSISAANFTNGLRGKLSGVNISSPSTGPQGSSKIRVRGQASFGSDNSPLIVVNGVPITNISYGLGNNQPTGSHRTTDTGNGLNSINSGDIVSMTVLKNAAAAALYGARAANGVILITTKSRGHGNGVQINYNSNFTLNTPLDYTDYQMKYGQGEHGKRPTTPFPTSGVWSFGERFKPGEMQVLFDGIKVPYKPHPHHIKNFYRNAIHLNNTISISSGGENGGFDVTVSNLRANSIQPNSNYKRYNASVGFIQTFLKKLTVSGNVNYSKEKTLNPSNVAVQTYSPVVIYTLANSMPLRLMKGHCCDANDNEILWSRWASRTNPYFGLKNRFSHVGRDRVFGNVSARYNITDWLSLQGRVGEDYYFRHSYYNDPTGSQRLAPAPTGFVNGQIVRAHQRVREVNSSFRLVADKNFGGSNGFGINILFGGNRMHRTVNNNSVTGQDFYERGLYTIGNSRLQTPAINIREKRINSLYGSATLSYHNLLFITGTGRNDWFSTLSPGHRSIFYPSISASFVFTSALKSARPNWLTFGKLRFSFGEVGSDSNILPFSNALFYSLNNKLFNNSSLGGIQGTNLPNRNLQPERVHEYDVGFNLQIYSRYSFIVTLYDKITGNQIINKTISNASGFESTNVNTAKSRNEGVEMSVNLKPIMSKNFSWNIIGNAAYNKSKVLSLGKNIHSITVGSAFFHGDIRQVVGKEMDQLYGIGFLRDNQGRKVFNKRNGIPLFTKNELPFGSGLPNWTGGFTNRFNYKNLSLSFLIDFKLGNKLISGTDVNAYREGFDKRTLRGRKQGYVIGDGVNPAGSRNKTHAEIQSFYESIRSVHAAEQSVFNGGWWRLDRVSIGYDFTSLIPKNAPIRDLKLTFLINNALLLKKWTPNIDPAENPDVSDRRVGLVSTGLPTTRGIGFNLNVKF
jgi:TonB-linked SusC/RagA family outer membrane protein